MIKNSINAFFLGYLCFRVWEATAPQMEADGAPALQQQPAPRGLQSGGEFSDYVDAYLLFFGLQLVFFIAMPLTIMLWRLARSARSKSCGFMTMFKAPIGRVGDKRSPAAALRFFLFQETQLGYYADLAQVRVAGGRQRGTPGHPAPAHPCHTPCAY